MGDKGKKDGHKNKTCTHAPSRSHEVARTQDSSTGLPRGLDALLSVFPWKAGATQQELTRALDKLLI